jgi:hypothetical protein
MQELAEIKRKPIIRAELLRTFFIRSGHKPSPLKNRYALCIHNNKSAKDDKSRRQGNKPTLLSGRLSEICCCSCGSLNNVIDIRILAIPTLDRGKKLQTC